MTTQTADRTYTFKEAIARYGEKEYHLHHGDFPEEPHFNQVKEAIRMNLPTDNRVDKIVTTIRDKHEGYCNAAIVFHFPDYAVYVEYQET